MDNRLLLIYNPTAGKGRIGGQIAGIEESLAGAGWQVTVRATCPGRDAEQILAEEGAGFDRVVCCGGDGTLHHTVNGLMALPKAPPLGYLPCGSTNDFARTLQLTARPAEDCAAAAGGAPFGCDVGRFNGRYFSYVAAFGAFTDVSYLTAQEEKNQLGHLAYLLEGAKRLPIGKNYPARVECNGQVFEDGFLYGAVSNSVSIGGFALGGKEPVLLDDGLFELLLVKTPANLAEAGTLAAKLLAREFDGQWLRLLRTDRVRFSFEEETAWTLDGEFGGNLREAEIEVCPRALTLLRPAQQPEKAPRGLFAGLGLL